MLVSENVPFVVILLAWAIFFVFNRVMELLADIAISVGLSPFVPLLNGVSRRSRISDGLHTLCPIKHARLPGGLAYHFSKSFSPHFFFLVFAKSRYTMTTRFWEPDFPSLGTTPRSRNFCEVESGRVVSPRARMVKPKS